jgi:hypothetical protein
MTGLRAAWNERMFRRLCTRLARLRSPFTQLDSFAIRMDSDEFPQYSGELRSDILERAPYRIDAVFDGKQTIEIVAEGVVRHQRLSRRVSSVAIRRTARRLAPSGSAPGQQSRCAAEQQPSRGLRRDHE